MEKSVTQKSSNQVAMVVRGYIDLAEKVYGNVGGEGRKGV